MTTSTASTRFVILSEARSGTSLLTETLDSHPEITCHGEVFHPDPAWHFRGSMAEWSTDALLKLRAEKAAFLDRVFDQPDVKAVGFKMWRIQAPDECERLLADGLVSKIILERRNKLSQFSSTLLAHQTGVWNLGADAGDRHLRPAPLVFNAGAFRNFVAFQEDTFAYYRSEAVGPVLNISFSSLVQDGFDRVQDFLGVQGRPLDPQKRRLHGTDILARFQQADHAAIRAELESLGQPGWATE